LASFDGVGNVKKPGWMSGAPLTTSLIWAARLSSSTAGSSSHRRSSASGSSSRPGNSRYNGDIGRGLNMCSCTLTTGAHLDASAASAIVCSKSFSVSNDSPR